MNEKTISEKFTPNWVFWLFNQIRIPYVLVAMLVSAAVFLIGVIFSAIFKVMYTYISNRTLYLNLAGIFLAFVAFGWFVHKLPSLLAKLAGAFVISQHAYVAIIEKWAGRIANKILWMILAALFFAIPNLFETIDYWRSPSPPILLVPWVESNASLFFAFFYGFLHVIIVPFILGSGVVGMIGVVCLVYDIFQKPLKLTFYRYTEGIIELTAWLLMWALIGLASILVFGRQFIIFPTDILSTRISALIQSILATLIVLGIGTAPLFMVRATIEKAKNKALKPLESLYDRTNTELNANLHKGAARKYRELQYKVIIIKNQMEDIKKIPSIPIRLPSIFRITIGAVFSLISTFLQDWLVNRVGLT